MIDRASTPFLALQGERTAQDGFKMVRSVVLGGILNAIMRKMESRLITLTRQSSRRAALLGLSTGCYYAQSYAIESP